MRERLWLASGCALGLGTLFFALSLSPLGYEFTDEGFYLASMATPGEYVYVLSLFGHVYHLPYLLLEGSIAGMRAFNMLTIYSLAFGLCWSLVRKLLPEAGRGEAAGLAGALAASSLLVLSLNGKWLATPSYNSLAFAATLLVATGLVRCCLDPRRAPLDAWALIGIGGWLAFMSKPTTAALLALLVPLLLAACGKLEWSGILAAAGLAGILVLVSALAVSHSLPAFVDLMSRSIAIMGQDGTGHDLASSLFRFGAVPRGPRAVIMYAGAVLMLVVAWRAGPRHSRWILLVLVAVAVLAALLVQRVGIGEAYAKEAFIQLVLLAALVLACLLAAVARHVRRGAEDFPRQRLLLAAFFLVLPHVYAFGTNNDALVQASAVGIFWILAGLLSLSYVMDGDSLRGFVPRLAIGAAAAAAFIVHIASESPYRQSGPLRDASVPVTVGPEQSPLRLSAPEARVLADIRAASGSATLQGQHAIDLSGTSPGVLFALGARNVGAAWLVGGYSGSESVAIEILRQVPCSRLAGAWILTGSTRNALSPAVLEAFGASLSAFAGQAVWTNPLDGDRLELGRPVRAASRAEAECQRTRPPPRAGSSLAG